MFLFFFKFNGFSRCCCLCLLGVVSFFWCDLYCLDFDVTFLVALQPFFLFDFNGI